jgi:hypothetical protein
MIRKLNRRLSYSSSSEEEDTINFEKSHPKMEMEFQLLNRSLWYKINRKMWQKRNSFCFIFGLVLAIVITFYYFNSHVEIANE